MFKLLYSEMGKRRTFGPKGRLGIMQEDQREGEAATCLKYCLASCFICLERRFNLNRGLMV
jgi:hypothetical protein